MLASSKRQALEAAQDEAYIVISASDAWAPGWKKTPKQWQEAIRIENRLRRGVAGYYRDFAKRSGSFVNWMAYAEAVGKVSAADDGEEDDQFIYREKLLQPDGATTLVKIIFDQFTEAARQGAAASEELTHRWIGQSDLFMAIDKKSLAYVEKLRSNLSQTDYDRVKQSLNTSLRLGENAQQAAERLFNILADEDRAKMIARTEMSRAYNSGIMAFGRASGAEMKVWESQAGACVICDAIGAEAVPIDSSFDSGDDYPPAHPNCRCLVYLVYGDSGKMDPDSE